MNVCVPEEGTEALGTGVVSSHTDAGNSTWILWKSRQFS